MEKPIKSKSHFKEFLAIFNISISEFEEFEEIKKRSFIVQDAMEYWIEIS